MFNTRCQLLLGVLWAAAGTSTLAEERHIDFGGQSLPFDMKTFGPQAAEFIKAEEDGLRVLLPKDRKQRVAVGVSFPVHLPGDFDVTARVTILQAEGPTMGYGVGVLLGVKHSVRIGRLARAGGEQVVLWDRNVGAGTGKPKLEGEAFPCPAEQL